MELRDKRFYSIHSYKFDFEYGEKIRLENLKELMNKYKIDVPIVSIINGNEYQHNIEYRKVLSRKSHI